MKKTILIFIIFCFSYKKIFTQTKEETIIWLIETHDNSCGNYEYQTNIDINTGYLSRKMEVIAGTYFNGIKLKNIEKIEYEKIRVIGGDNSYASGITLHGISDSYFIPESKGYSSNNDRLPKLSISLIFCKDFDKSGYINRYIKALSHLVYLYSNKKPIVIYQNKNKKSPF
jgi:hypothetical protein